MATEQLELENLGSIITLKGTNDCLGFLMDFREKGIWCPSYGEVGRFGVTKEHADAHNKALDEATLKGLDENCQIGQGGSFYLTKDKRAGVHGDWLITTFIGTIVAENASVTKTRRVDRETHTRHLAVTFQRNGKSYKGSNNGFDDLVFFERIS